MFGYVQANLSNLSQKEQQRYRAAYCGLCHTLGERHGFTSRLGLTYDLTFLTLLSRLEASSANACRVAETAAPEDAEPDEGGSSNET